MTDRKIFLCVPNFSEGRDGETVAALSAAVREGGAALMHASADADHNRSVLAFCGDTDQIVESLIRAAAEAVRRIDLRGHAGVHPRFGAVDVAPVVPAGSATMQDAVEVSRRMGRRLGEELGIPVFLYEHSATREDRRNLAEVRNLRKLGLDAPLAGAAAPDFGPGRFHPTAGASAVGARGPLVAYNVNIQGLSLEDVRDIASRIRHMRDAGEGMPGVKAMGVYLESQGLAQVSTNVCRPDECRPRQVFEFVRAEAEALGAEQMHSELIGIVSRNHLSEDDIAAMRFLPIDPRQFVEHWLR